MDIQAQFVHLHLHSQYSLLDGAIHLDKLFDALKDRRMDAVAQTDHGFMYGSLDFYLKAKKAEVHPIIGCEAYITSSKMSEKKKRDANYHLVLLARTQEGYNNLQYMMSMAALKGFYYNPRIDHELLQENSKGLIGLSACLGGEIPRTFFAQGYEAAKKLAERYARHFEDGWFFLELQDNKIAEQDIINENLIKISKETGIPLVATNDCHYLNREDAFAQEILMAISQGKKITDENRMKHSIDELYLKSPEEMISAFSSVPEAITNTVKIAKACQVEIPNNQTREKPVYFLPVFDTPDNESSENYMRRVSREGLKQRLEEIAIRDGKVENETEYFSRLDYELEIIIDMGFEGYFLIVSDFIKWSKAQGIPVGPGRGSGAGSIVAYSLKITELDPIKYGLLFERFLNPERISMPDFDIDFCKNRRDEVLRYIKEKYGENNVAQISTFSTLKSRVAVRDVGRVMDIPLKTVDKLAKAIPMGSTINEALNEEPKFKKLAGETSELESLVENAQKLEGMFRHPGVHAAGVVISDKPIWETVPAARGKVDVKGASGMDIPIVTQYDKDMTELASLVKFDFLGLDNLTKIAEAVKRINVHKERNKEKLLDINLIPLDDPGVFEMLSQGKSGGVFQMESEGFSQLLKGLKPDKFEDLIAAVALYRPGPLSNNYDKQFIDSKHGRIKVEYPHPWLENILKETYGVIIYQEQVMLTARKLADFSLGQADILRKAMGKKKIKLMAELKDKFVEGCVKNKIDREQAENIFKTLEEFAKYGFNKSHSAAYALISYQTAWLRYHYPEEFMAGILTCECNNPDKVMKYLRISSKMGINVLPPDINESEQDFTIIRDKDNNKVIRFGLGAIKGVGESAVQALIEAKKDNKFESIFDICRTVDLRRVNKGVLEALVKSGALDNLYPEAPEKARAVLLETVEIALRIGNSYQKEQNSNQTSLFDLFDDDVAETKDPEYPDTEPWLNLDMLEKEREVLGIYLSGHPLHRFLNSDDENLKKNWSHTVGELQEIVPRNLEDNERSYHNDIIIPGIISQYTERRAKQSKSLYARGEIDGMDGLIGYFISSRYIEDLRKTVTSREPLLIYGALEISKRNGSLQRSMKINKVETFSELVKKGVKYLRIKIDVINPPQFIQINDEDEWIANFASFAGKYPGKINIVFKLTKNKNWSSLIRINKQIEFSARVRNYMEQKFGKENISWLKRKPSL
ncbi:MAG: DNA polymerase III subunit alpha [Deltaproteobacteria bacterium]|jgi:DNA polymerase-3 subunit alpha|nr:DNA polymerase III subunit alpha [Deltaproteobacteria bacterium]